VSDSKTPVYSSKLLKCDLKIVQLNNTVMARGMEYVAHMNALTTNVSIKHLYDLASNKPLRMAREGDLVGAHLEFIDPVPAAKFKDIPALGQFVLRMDNTTVAVVTVNGIKPQ
jgi:translation elongation factor EF-1alpha